MGNGGGLRQAEVAQWQIQELVVGGMIPPLSSSLLFPLNCHIFPVIRTCEAASLLRSGPLKSI